METIVGIICYSEKDCEGEQVDPVRCCLDGRSYEYVTFQPLCYNW